MNEENAKQIIDTINKFVRKRNLSAINKLLTGLHPSERYEVIGAYSKNSEFMDVIREERKKATKGECSPDKPYQTYQDLKAEAIKSHEHDETPAKMIDIDRALSNAYVILVNMIGVLNETVNKQSEAINRIEERLEMKLTDFNERSDGSDAVANNVQGDQKSGESPRGDS